ncbi:MAG: phage late control D family protein [Candidatus Binataceae bacterium]
MLIYQGVNITTDVSSMVTGITYFDVLEGGAGEIEVELEDHQQLWQGAWSPQLGDNVTLLLGYEGDALLPCGNFQIDEVELSGPPDTVHLRCLEAWITPAMRTRNSLGYEDQTLPEIAATIARKYALTVIGVDNSPNVAFERVTQRQETDLEFLRRLAKAQGYDFTVRGTQMVFYAISALESAAPALELGRSDVLGFGFISKTHEMFKDAQVSYQQPSAKQLITQSLSGTPLPPTGDTVKLVERCENSAQALLKAQSLLHELNSRQRTASVTTPGSTRLAAGNVITLSGFGVNDGSYLIEVARHRLTRSTGYTTEVAARELGFSTTSVV